MKKKMNMLCVVILVFTIVMVAASFHFVFYFHDMDKSVMELFVSPSHFGDDNCVMFTDGASGKPVKGWASRVFVETGKDTFNVKTGMKMIALAPLSLIGLVTWVLFVAYLIKFVIAVNKGMVFTWRTIRLLRQAGWAALVSNVSLIIMYASMLCIESGMFSLKGYAFDYSDVIEQISSLLPGLLLLLMAQTFGIGLKQKEELEQVV